MRIGLLCLLLLGAFAAPAPAQTPPTGAAALMASDSFLPTVARSRVKGSEDAPVTIIELSDFQCPFCGEFARNTLAALDSAYIQTGKVRLIYFNYPLPSHHQAWSAAEAALCAGAQDAFWPMHDRLFAHQSDWSGSGRAAEMFAGYAAETGIDVEAWRTCTLEDRVSAVLVDDLMQATRTGAEGTPTFIFNGERAASGALPFSEIQKIIEEMLNG